MNEIKLLLSVLILLLTLLFIVTNNQNVWVLMIAFSFIAIINVIGEEF